MRLLLASLCILFLSCKQDTKTLKQTSYKGETMGTFYSIKFLANETIPQSTIDAKLIALNDNFSTYIDNSQISQFNKAENLRHTLSGNQADEFEDVFLIAHKIYQSSQGKFDPTVKPLVDYWGFGKEKKPRAYTQEEVDSLRTHVGFEKVGLERIGNEVLLSKTQANVELDFSAIAKGFGVDKIAELLKAPYLQIYYSSIRNSAKSLRASYQDYASPRQTPD